MNDQNDVHEIKFEPARFPPDFIGAVADSAESILSTYLRKNSPKLHRLFEAYVCLTDYKASAQARQTTPMMNTNVVDYLSQMTCILAELRHSFRSQGDGGEYMPYLDWVDLHTGNTDKDLEMIEKLWPELDPHSKRVLLATLEMFVDCDKGNLPADVAQRIDLAVREDDDSKVKELVVELGYLQ